MTMDQVFKRDNLMVKVLREEHRGCENPMTSEQASKYLSEHGYSVKPRNIGTLINRLAIERILPICYINGKGYYWATRKNEIQIYKRKNDSN